MGALCSDNSGNIYAAGLFSNTTGNAYVAKYDGTKWSELGGPDALACNGTIYTMCSDKTGNIYIAGNFTNANNKNYVAKYDGSKWSELGGVDAVGANGTISSICTDNNGNIYAAGSFKNTLGKYYVAKYNGSKWTELGTATDSIPPATFLGKIETDSKNQLYISGDWQDSTGLPMVKWDDTKFSNLKSANASKINYTMITFAIDNKDNLYSAGILDWTDMTIGILKWDGTDWSETGGSMGLKANGQVFSMCSDKQGNIYAAGKFANANGLYYVAKCDGYDWTEVGGASPFIFGESMDALCSDIKGNIYAAGAISDSSGNKYVAKYNNIATGMQSSFRFHNISIFSNPTSDKINIDFKNQNAHIIYLYNSAGQLVLIEKTTKQESQLNIENFAQGLYILQILDTANETTIVKIVKL